MFLGRICILINSLDTSVCSRMVEMYIFNDFRDSIVLFAS